MSTRETLDRLPILYESYAIGPEMAVSAARSFNRRSAFVLSRQKLGGVAYCTAKLALGGNFQFGPLGVKSEFATYTKGQSVNLVINVQNVDVYGQFHCTIYNNDTGNMLVGFGDYLDINSGKTYTIYVGIMPDHDWNFRVEVTP